jgi:6-phosphogluconate dehydrogenase
LDGVDVDKEDRVEKLDIGLIGLAVMGQNLALNMARNGFRVAVYNRTAEATQAYLSGPASGTGIQPAVDPAALAAALKPPRVVMLMVRAGAAVDAVIESVAPHLEPGDVIIDGGNSHFRDTERRIAALSPSGIRFLGTGISGGEEGALRGPSIMPGGDREGYAVVERIFTAIAARVNGDPCVAYLGPGGSGHYVKMIHNGIEYAVMQLIAEVYDLLRRGTGLSAGELSAFFKAWNRGPLESFLVEATGEVLAHADPESGKPLVELVLDQASQKGTGKWTSQEALDLGTPVPTISAAVEARNLSARLAEREAMATAFPGGASPQGGESHAREALVSAAGEGLYAATILTYAQGMQLLRAASREYSYGLDLSEIARIWRGGCIIRARLLEEVRRAYAENPDLPGLALWPPFQEALSRSMGSLRKVLHAAIDLGIPAPALGSALAAFDGWRSQRLPANLIQALRDYFGAHTFRRVDREGTFHSDWGRGKAG